MSAEEEFGEAVRFFAEACNAALAALERRIDALEASAIRRDPFFTRIAPTAEERTLYERMKRGDIP